MSEAFQYIDILILAIIAGIVLLRLRSVLGRKASAESWREQLKAAPADSI